MGEVVGTYLGFAVVIALIVLATASMFDNASEDASTLPATAALQQPSEPPAPMNRSVAFTVEEASPPPPQFPVADDVSDAALRPAVTAPNREPAVHVMRSGTVRRLTAPAVSPRHPRSKAKSAKPAANPPARVLVPQATVAHATRSQQPPKSHRRVAALVLCTHVAVTAGHCRAEGMLTGQ